MTTGGGPGDDAGDRTRRRPTRRHPDLACLVSLDGAQYVVDVADAAVLWQVGQPGCHELRELMMARPGRLARLLLA